MKTLNDILVEAQALVTDLQALIASAPVAPEITSETADLSNGSTETLVPEAPVPQA